MDSKQAIVILTLNVDTAGSKMPPDVKNALILAIIALNNQPDLHILDEQLVMPNRSHN